MRGLFLATLCSAAATGTVQAATANPSITVNSLTASPATVTPGQTVTFSTTLTSSATASGYPVEFSWVPPGSTTGTNVVDSANFKAGTSVQETASWTVPTGTAAGTYTLYVAAYNPGWSTKLATKTITFTVAKAAAAASIPMAVTVNSLTASPPSVQPGQTVTFSATLTANQAASSYPVEFSWLPTGSSTATDVVDYATYTAGTSIVKTATWTVPTGTAAGTYTLDLSALNLAGTAQLASSSTTFTVAAAAASTGTSTTASAPGPNAALYAAPFYSCVRNYYVSPTGSNSNPGTQASPWLTIQNADTTSRQGGDCINVAPGTYEANVLIQHGGSAPTPTGYVVYRCETLDGCHVLAPGTGHVWGFEKGGNFVVVDGFEVDGNNALLANGIGDACFGSDGDTYGTGNSSHHLWVLNNIIHDCAMSGIQFNNKEWYYVIDNTVYHNSWTSGYQGSGISFVVVQCIESGNSACASGSTYAGGTGTYVPSGMDLTYAAPYHNIVAGNNVYDNMIAATNPVACGNHTDGNGIIMDTFLDETTASIVFPYQTLVRGNLSYDNGGRGIHIFRTSNATVANNTVYANGTDTCISSYGLADLSQIGGSNNVWINNIAQSVVTAANPDCSYCGANNVPLVAGYGPGPSDSNNTYSNNITYGGVGSGPYTYGTTGLGLYNNDITYYSCTSNKCNTNPMLVAPTTSNFAVQSTSPAVAYGIVESYLPATAVDVGACSHTLSTCE